MKNTISLADFKAMIDNALQQIKAREDEFSQLDAVIGDGDHGQAIATAMSVVAEKAATGSAFKSMLGDMGMEVLMQVSGSTSTLLGALFLGMSDGVGEVTELSATDVKKMFASALKNVLMQTKAKVGDKTMMDALQPAVDAIVGSSSEDIAEILKGAAEAAIAGAEATIEMKANFGRARNYGEKSIGTMDSGAASWSCMFAAFAEAIE
ncbi:MAG: dihydroxyacetone kinase subunit L [Alistipes sp.]|nr:dihydroxyacetone kinase subunit L [Alistipes sp.]